MAAEKILEYAVDDLRETWKTLTPPQKRMIKKSIGGGDGRVWPALMSKKLATPMMMNGRQLGWKLNRRGFALAALMGNRHAQREIA